MTPTEHCGEIPPAGLLIDPARPLFECVLRPGHLGSHAIDDGMRWRVTPDAPLTPYAKVQGRCPACGGESLFLGDGGYVTCFRLGCPSPDTATTLLEKRPARDQPASPRRLSINELSSDQLDELYDRLERTRRQREIWTDHAVHLASRVNTAEAQRDQVKCPTCGPKALEPHPRLPVQRCSNCKEHLPTNRPSEGK